jgi:hypothetical protein
MPKRTGLAERLRLRLDDSLRVRMTRLGYEALDGDVTSVVEGLEEIEGRARSQSVRGWANSGRAFLLLAARRSGEAEAAFAAHPDPASQPMLGLALEVSRGHLDRGFAAVLADCTYGISAMGVARVVTDAGRLDDVVQQTLELPRGRSSGALLALQAGLQLLREYEPAIRIGTLVWERQQWAISAYWVAVASAAIGDASAAVTWLDRAADCGFFSVRTIDRDRRFDSIQQLPDFIAARARVAGNPSQRMKDLAHGGLLWLGRRESAGDWPPR